jgi:hypothetical protein
VYRTRELNQPALLAVCEGQTGTELGREQGCLGTECSVCNGTGRIEARCVECDQLMTVLGDEFQSERCCNQCAGFIE